MKTFGENIFSKTFICCCLKKNYHYTTATNWRLPYVVNYYCLMSWSRDDFLIFRLVIWRVFFSVSDAPPESITYVKFRYSEKATKFWKKSSTLLWQYLQSNFKPWNISSNFVSFSQYLNFTYVIDSGGASETEKKNSSNN